MSDEILLTPEELLHQAQAHLASLQAAGVQWLPMAPAPQITLTTVESTPEEAKPADERGPALVVEDDLFAAPTLSALSAEERRRSLDVLAEEISQCTRCKELVISRTRTVPGEGALDPPLCFIGEAPGFNEDRLGRPFVGEAGQLLDRIIAACGFKREEVYICNILKCRPPGNRTPLATEADNCRPFLDRQLELVRPQYICCLGACAAQNLLQTTQGIGRLRKRFLDYKGIPVMCTYHPAYLLRNPAAKKDVWDDMKMLLAKMGRPIPGK